MMMEEFGLPCFIDIEASGFGPESYPIEVAWSAPSGEIKRKLISPAHVPEWQYWNEDSEAIHGIDRERLERNGWDPAYVMELITEDLSDLTVFCDAPEFDGPWLQRLFDLKQLSLPFSLAHVEDLLIPLLRSEGEMEYQAVVRLDALKKELAPKMSGKHAAGYDVGYLIQLWRRAQGQASKMNHGIGPMPEITDTGSFRRVKKELEKGMNDQ